MTTRVTRARWKAAGIVGVILVALGVWASTRETTPAPPSTGTATTTTTTGVPGSAVPVFRTDATHLPVSPDSSWLVANLINHGSLSGKGQIAPELCLSAGNSYCGPRYDVATATGTRPLFRKASFPGSFNLPLGSRQPVSPAWKPSQGKDGLIQLYDSAGHIWQFWNWSWSGWHTDVNNNFACSINGDNIAAGFLSHGMEGSLCAASANELTDPKGVPVDWRTWLGNFPAGGGGGWLVPAPGPDQVASGDIGMALHLATVNTMFGPACPAGHTLDRAKCGWAVSPAGQFERAAGFGTTSTDRAVIAATSNRLNTIPEGTRFRLTLTDGQIESWLDSRGYKGTLRDTARTIARGLRTYGMFLGDSTAYAASLSFSQSTASHSWASLGIVGDGKNLLDGLFTVDSLVALAPPTSTCADGTKSTLWCWATDIRYGS